MFYIGGTVLAGICTALSDKRSAHDEDADNIQSILVANLEGVGVGVGVGMSESGSSRFSFSFTHTHSPSSS